MVSLLSLWAPTLLAAVLVFVASSVIHMFLKYHESNYLKLPDQDAIGDALRAHDIAPGDYMMPNMCDTDTKMGSPEFNAAFEKGPVIIMTVWPNGAPAMGKSLAQWFVYCLVVAHFAGYVAAISLPMGTDYMTVFRVTAVVAFAGYSLAVIQNSIWKNQNWVVTAKFVFDGLVYALITAGCFGWLWPQPI
jgi:hypothetical protein